MIKIITFLILLVGSSIFGQKITTLFEGGGVKNIFAGDYDEDTYAYANSGALYLYYKEKWIVLTNQQYKINGTTYNVSFGNNNIKEIATDGSTYIVTTKDNHVLYYLDGMCEGGAPFEVNHLKVNIEDEFYGVVTYVNNTYLAKLGDNVGKIYTLVNTNIDDDLDKQLKTFGYNNFSYDINGGTLAAISGDQSKLAYIYEDGYKMKEYTKPTSYLPCNKFNLISHTRTGTKISSIACLCDDNKLFILNHSLKDFGSEKLDVKQSEWSEVNKNAINGNIKMIKFFGREYPEWGGNAHLFGFTDATQNAIFVFNPVKKTFCTLDLPGNDKVQDIELTSRHYILVTAGEKIYHINIDDWLCESGITAAEEETTTHIDVYPNPSSNDFKISNLPSNSTITLHNSYGHKIKYVKSVESTFNFGADLLPGIYFLKINADEKTITKTIIKL